MANPAGKAILTVLGVFGSMVGFTGFLLNEFPNKEIHMVDRQQQAQDSMVRVVVALNGVEELTDADGPIPGVVAFDENKSYIGASDWSRGFGHIGSGGYADIWVSQRKGPGRQATYLQSLARMMVSVLPMFLNFGEMVRREDGWEIWTKLAGSGINIRTLLLETTTTVHVISLTGRPVEILG